MITSNQNPKIKRIRGLQTQAKLRRKELAYVAEGVRLLEEVVSAGQTPEIVIYTKGLEQRGAQLLEHFHQLDINIEEVYQIFSVSFLNYRRTGNKQGRPFAFV